MGKKTKRSQSKESNGNSPRMDQKRRSDRNSKQASKGKPKKEEQDFQTSEPASEKSSQKDFQLESGLIAEENEEYEHIPAIIEEDESTSNGENSHITNKSSSPPTSLILKSSQ